MKTTRLFRMPTASASLAIYVLTLFGCSQPTELEGPMLSAPAGSETVDAHPTEGPHQGSLIELGEEAYHAEMIHDEDAGSVTIYLLDSKAKINVPIEAAELTINLKQEGQSKQFLLASFPDASDPSGKSSRFQSTDAELTEALDQEGTVAQLVVSIDGKQYRGTIQHEHDEDSHTNE
ncbi:hypothetical protein [Bythopirellula polymerisocia]|uniref:Uncharacterized protein n=1 Tax=Bythopirellula polymerisocia TaxID=2528003 RepID=A0A5C6CUZ7_9BACT|nr:hypothetical protein [Bythopirellula polymerisocia]TWU27484.1 hypothetical protein Pla144_22580 [Bythopirellula polymerisocia]